MSEIIFRNEQKNGVVTDDSRAVIGVMYEENFGALLPFIRDVEITDINWNGKDLWIDDVSRGRYNAGIKLEQDFVDAFCIRVANVVSKTFNKYYPRLEAETDDLRITIIHKSVSHTGTAISIRKTPIVKRITFAKSIREDYYCPEEVANLLSNSVKARFNIVIGGLPGVGKTELVKYLTNYIFPRDRVITIEDTMEIHYSKINPNKDCIELKVDDNIFTYTDAIKSCLRLLPQWILLSEARSKEVQYLLESISTGAKCITTIHTDDMRKVPKRVVNMMGDMDNSALAEQMAYSYFDLGILVDKNQDVQTGKITRYIAQIVMYYEENGKNECIVLYNRGKLTGAAIPEEVLQQFSRMGIADPWKYTYIEDTHQDADDITGFLDGEGSDDELAVMDDTTTGVTGSSTSRYTDDDSEILEGDSSENTETDEDEDVAESVEVSVEEDNDEVSTGYTDSSDEEKVEASDYDSSEEATGYTDESETDTGYVEETPEEIPEEPTGIIDDSENETGYVEETPEEVKVADDSETETGYVEEAPEEVGYVFGSESGTGYIGNVNSEVEEIIGSESETGYVGDEEATGDIDEQGVDPVDVTGDVDEQSTGFIEPSNTGNKSRKNRNRKGRR